MSEANGLAPAEIEVGAALGELRLWKAREALRQGELSLKSQTDARDNLRAAATSVLGWAVAGIGVLVAAALSTGHPAWQGAAVVTVASLLAVSVLGLTVLFPRRLARPGFDPDQVLSNPEASELGTVEAFARGLSRDMESNRVSLIWSSTLLRVAWLAFALTPALGLVTLGLWNHGAEGLLAPLLRVVGHTNG